MRDGIALEDFQVESIFREAIWTRLQPELMAAKNTQPQHKINFELLYQLTRALANVIILTQEQGILVRSFHKPDEQTKLIPSILHILYRIPSDLLKDPEMTMNKKRNFVLFITHAFRLLLICQAVDKTILDADRNPKTLK